MSGITWLAIQLHSWLVRLYPASFREEYGAELIAVFAKAITEASRASTRAALVVLLRELRDYPFSLLREHWRSPTQLEVNPVGSARKPEWFFYPSWIAVSTISIPIAGGVAWALVLLILRVIGGTIQVGGQTRITEDYLFSYILLLVLGPLAGFLQYLLLRRHLPRMGWWIVATTTGLLLGLVGGRLFFFPLHGALDRAWYGTVMTMLLGGSVGLAQWFVLRQYVPHAAWWVLANVLGWGVVGWGAATLSNQMVIAIVGVMLAPGIATSATLWLLLDQLPRRDGGYRSALSDKATEPVA